tara:strand:- start:4252 stop:5061 length:810 start_codon:yes stop_codon:yes gene_type:complete
MGKVIAGAAGGAAASAGGGLAGALLPGALISGGIQLITGLFSMGAARRREREAAKEKRRLQAKLTSLENSRQEIINPYEGVTDLSSMITNPYASLGVATQAAEIQIEQADISLANTLDTIRATGASAGGATALAQAALQSKKGVSATIEAQEAQNEKLRASGKQQQQQMKMSEAQRLQQADVAGEQFMFTAREGREAEQLDRVSAQLSGAEAKVAQASADRTGALTGMAGGLASTAGSFFSAAASSNKFSKQGYAPPPVNTVSTNLGTN